MAVQIYYQNGIQHYLGLSTDAKPTPADVSATFLELDGAQDAYIFNGSNWIKLV